MPNNSSNTSRIAKNTVLLYFRMAITMPVGLYTSRVVQNALGVDDLGTYNVCNGLIVIFGNFFNAKLQMPKVFCSFFIRNGLLHTMVVFSILFVVLNRISCIFGFFIYNGMNFVGK